MWIMLAAAIETGKMRMQCRWIMSTDEPKPTEGDRALQWNKDHHAAR